MIVAVALAVGGLVFAAVLIVLTTHRRALVHRRLGPYVAGVVLRRSRGAESSKSGRLTGQVDDLLRRAGLHDRLVLAIERAGLDVAPGAFAGLVAGSSAVAFLLLFILSGLALGFAGAVLAVAAPCFVLFAKAARRKRAFEAQLPEILDTLAASLKAGHGFDQALQTVASDVAEPAGGEFNRVLAEVHLGRSLEDALGDLGNRVRSADFQFVLDAIAIQRQVGGSLAELFELVAETVRSREQFRRKLSALTGMVRMSANVLTALPVAAAALLTLVNRSYMSPLWETSTGHVMVGVAVVMMVCGALFLRRVGLVKG